MFFKNGIEPKWEDPKNEFGGSLIIELTEMTQEILDGIWKGLTFRLIG